MDWTLIAALLVLGCAEVLRVADEETVRKMRPERDPGRDLVVLADREQLLNPFGGLPVPNRPRNPERPLQFL